MAGPVKVEPQKAPAPKAAKAYEGVERAPVQAAGPMGSVSVLSQPMPPNGGPSKRQAVLHLQRTIGNQATGRLLRTLADKSSPPGLDPVQSKLTVGRADDPYEREADAAASQIESGQPVERISRLPATGPAPSLYRQNEEEVEREEERKDIETEPVQRACAACDGDEPAQRQVEEKEEEALQTTPLQRQVEEEEQEQEPVQADSVQRETANPEDEEPVQTQPAATESALDTGRAAEAMARTGGGTPLGSFMQAKMERGFGADFSNVRIHTGSAAVEASDAINARAFTRGSDIYMGRGASPNDTRLMAHELTHTMQQGGARLQRTAPTAVYGGTEQRTTGGDSRHGNGAPENAVYRWGSPEHMKLGDITGRRIDIGGGAELTFGQVVALAGDEFGSLEELRDATQTDKGRAMIRAHLERAKIQGDTADLLPAPTSEQREQASSEYITLAMDNSAHFSGGGTAVENWLEKHAEAIDLAIQAGLHMDTNLLNQANFTEAFGDHFLTDAFSSGHIRVPREEITEYYVNEFAPRVFDHLINHLRNRLIDEVYDQVEKQTVLNEAAWALGPIGGLGARSYIRGEIRDDINSKLDEAFVKAGGRQEAVRYLGLGMAGIVAGAMHDMENEEGLWVVSDIHPQPWQAYGDDNLDKNPEHRQRVEEAVLASLADLQTAYDIGLDEGQILFNVVEPEWLPVVIYFGFDSDALTAEAASVVDTVADYLNYNPSTVVVLTGHADPIGDDPYNVDLGWRRANRAAQRLLTGGVDATKLDVETLGESAPVTTSRRDYHRNRRVEFSYSTGADIEDNGPANTALENAREATLGRVGPPYEAERHLPRAAEGLNEELPAWRWGDIPESFRGKMADWIKHYVNEYAEEAISGDALNDIQKDTDVGEFTISPRPIARKLIKEILADPIGFLERAVGRSAGP